MSSVVQCVRWRHFAWEGSMPENSKAPSVVVSRLCVAAVATIHVWAIVEGGWPYGFVLLATVAVCGAIIFVRANKPQRGTALAGSIVLYATLVSAANGALRIIEDGIGWKLAIAIPIVFVGDYIADAMVWFGDRIRARRDDQPEEL